MERVSQEWLSAIDQDALDKSGFGPVKSRDAYVLHLVQAVARECERLMDDELQRLDAVIVATATTDTVQASYNRGNISTRRDALRWAITQIRARFGLED